MISTKKLKENVQAELNTASELVASSEIQKIENFFEISSEELHNSTREEISSKIKSFFKDFNTTIIYVIEVAGTTEFKKIASTFSKIRNQKNKDFCFSKDNEKVNPYSTLYVGSSRPENLVIRMRRHFGVADKKVYSMHLKEWFPENIKCNLKVSVYKISVPENKLCNYNILEFIEQGLWNELQPMCGKRSGLL